MINKDKGYVNSTTATTYCAAINSLPRSWDFLAGGTARLTDEWELSSANYRRALDRWREGKEYSNFEGRVKE